MILYLSQAGCLPGVLGLVKSIGSLIGCLLGVLKTYISFGGGSHLFCFFDEILAIVLNMNVLLNIIVFIVYRTNSSIWKLYQHFCINLTVHDIHVSFTTTHKITSIYIFRILWIYYIKIVVHPMNQNFLIKFEDYSWVPNQ